MGPKLVVGLMGSSVANGATLLATLDGMAAFLSVCDEHHVHEIDTARVYAGGRSEALAGEAGACSRFAVSTKAPAFAPASLTYDRIIDNCYASLEALQTTKVDIYYIHGPDRLTPLEEQCRAIGRLYAEGKFARFGVSNLSDQEVKLIHEICQAQGYCLPSVYQGGYNPIGRGAEATLFPLLKSLNMNFYGFSPLGGGLLAKPISELISPGKGTRYEEMKVFGDIYLTQDIMTALATVQAVCDEEKISLMEATMGWLKWHSLLADPDWPGNAVIVGASSLKQLEGSLTAWETGSLPSELVRAWEGLHQTLKESGKVPSYHS